MLFYAWHSLETKPRVAVLDRSHPANKDLVFAIPALEGSADPHELVTGQAITLPANYSWGPDGLIGSGLQNSDSIFLPLPSTFDTSAPWTLMGRYVVDATATRSYYTGLKQTSTTERVFLSPIGTGGPWKIYSQGETAGDSGFNAVGGEKIFLGLVWDGSQFTLYRNGVALYSVTPSGTDWQLADRWEAAGTETVSSVERDNFQGAEAMRLFQRAVPAEEMMEFNLDPWRGLLWPARTLTAPPSSSVSMALMLRRRAA